MLFFVVTKKKERKKWFKMGLVQLKIIWTSFLKNYVPIIRLIRQFKIKDNEKYHIRFLGEKLLH